MINLVPAGGSRSEEAKARLKDIGFAHPPDERRIPGGPRAGPKLRSGSGISSLQFRSGFKVTAWEEEPG